MNEKEIREFLKGKSQEEIRDFIGDRLKKICDDAEKLSVIDENYEKAAEFLKIKKRI